MLDFAAFCQSNPVFFHVSTAGSWSQIQRHGLLSASAIQRLYGVDDAMHLHISNTRRSKSFSLNSELNGVMTIRDQAPLHLGKLARALTDGMTVQEWLDLIDSRVFFFTRLADAENLLKAKLYRDKPSLLLEINASGIFDVYHDRIEVADINTGAVLFKPALRGAHTFQKPGQYIRTGKRRIVEVTIPDAVRDIERFVVRALHRHPDSPEEVLFERQKQ